MTDSRGTGAIHLTVPAEDSGKRLDVVVGGLHEVGSRSQAAALIAAGAVSIDGVPALKSRLVEAGNEIAVLLPGEVVPEVGPRATVPVIYEDEHLLVVNKPAGMTVHPSRGHVTGTLVDALSGHGLAGGEEFRAGVVHRLDKDTSGLLVVAKSVEAHRRLVAMMKRRAVDRRYLALVHGAFSSDTGTIEAPVGRDPVKRTAMTVGGLAARDAVTHFTVLERLAYVTVVEAKLETGRTHQIRVHFAAIGHPVAGDPLYSRRDSLGVGRQFLHSYKLAFVHPFSGEELTFEAPLPEDLALVLERLRAAEDGPMPETPVLTEAYAKSVAIFDLDGTLVVGQTQVLLVRWLRKMRVVSLAFLVGTALWFVAYKAGIVKVTQATRQKGAGILAGLTEQRTAELMTRFTQEVMVPRLHPAAAAALQEHLLAGDDVVVVSAALDPLVKALCDHLGVKEFAAARCELVDGRYTGRLVGEIPYAGLKAKVAAELIAAHGADPGDCWAYADHDTDIELLRFVGHPVAVNPRPGLRFEAERLGWPILLSPEFNPGGAFHG